MTVFRKGIWVLAFLILSVIGGSFFQKSRYVPKVYDCFLFFNEFDILDIRLAELSDKVEKFILVESARTFQNNPKPLYFNENKERYAKYKDRIVHVIVDKFPEFGPVGKEDWWEAEIFQRDRIKVGLNACHPKPRDIVIVTDVDEIIRKEKIDEIVRLIDQEDNDIVFGSFDQYACFFNRQSREIWDICIATSWKNFSNYIRSAEDFRALSGFSKGHAFNSFQVLEKIKKAHPKKKWAFARTFKTGWHFTTIGGYQKLLQKLATQSHVANNTEAARDFNRAREAISDLPLCQIDSTYPGYVLEHLEEYRAKNYIDNPITIF